MNIFLLKIHFQIAEEGKEKDEKIKSGQDGGKEQSEMDENHFKSSGKDQDQAVWKNFPLT